MNKKTDKQKCLEMWQWLEAHPSMTKYDYRNHLNSLNLGHEYAPCWACRHANYECSACHITWDHQPMSSNNMCCDDNSVYFGWYKHSIELRKFYASEMVRLITETWKDEEEAL